MYLSKKLMYTLLSKHKSKEFTDLQNEVKTGLLGSKQQLKLAFAQLLPNSADFKC